MKIIVDQMPENAAKCKFHGDKGNDVWNHGKYLCKITDKVCPLEEGYSCRVCKTFSEMLTAYRL